MAVKAIKMCAHCALETLGRNPKSGGWIIYIFKGENSDVNCGNMEIIKSQREGAKISENLLQCVFWRTMVEWMKCNYPEPLVPHSGCISFLGKGNPIEKVPLK